MIFSNHHLRNSEYFCLEIGAGYSDGAFNLKGEPAQSSRCKVIKTLLPYWLGLHPKQDASHYQNYYIFSREPLQAFICRCYWVGSTTTYLLAYLGFYSGVLLPSH